MRILATLVKREWWECRGVFLYVPAIIGLVYIVVAVIGLLVISVANVNVNTTNLSYELIPSAIFSMSFLFAIVLWLAIINYFWNCLYTDRKDGSVLFWQSMPILQSQTLLSKLIMGLVVAPVVVWVCIVITEFIMFVLGGIALSVLGLSGSSILWHPGLIVLSWLSLLAALLIQGLWLISIIGWLMLCSAYAKKAPFLLAVIAPLVIIIIEAIIMRHQYFWNSIMSIFTYMGTTWQYFLSLMNNYSSFVSETQLTTEHSKSIMSFVPFQHLTLSDPECALTMLIGLLIGFIFIAIAGVLRSRCYGCEK